jgi:hypothetical protein
MAVSSHTIPVMKEMEREKGVHASVRLIVDAEIAVMAGRAGDKSH